jgi:PAS domain-containing protein
MATSEVRNAMTARPDRTEMGPILVAALDTLGLPILLHDYDQVLFANSSAAEILGAVRGADIAGLGLDAFLVPELASVTKERRAYLLRDGVVFADLPIKLTTLDGRTIRLRVDARPIAFPDRTIGMVTLKALEPGE